MRTKNNHPPRSLLREINQYSQSGFVPALSIRRPVLITEKEAKAIEKNIKRNFKRELPYRQAKGYETIKPGEWGLTLLERGKLASRLRETGSIPTSKDMMVLAGLMKALLLKQLAELPPKLPMELGAVERFGHGGGVKHKIGVLPVGWRGQRAHYPAEDKEGRPNLAGLLVAENKLCIEAIVGSNLLDENTAVGLLSATPHIAVVSNRNGIRDHEFRSVAPLILDALPEEILLGDPVIDIRPQPRFKMPLQGSLRPLDDLPAAA